MTTGKTRHTNCIVSFANNRGRYVDGIARLSNSLRDNLNGDFLAFIHEASVGAPLHLDSNYAFKIHATQKAIDAGYKNILWLDASCFAIKHTQPIFDNIERDGFIFQESGHMLGTWCNDSTLEYFGITRDEAMGIKLIGNAGFLGFDYSTSKGRKFWTEYRDTQQQGYFNGCWNNDKQTESEDDRVRGHRHDISCATAILHKMGLLPLMKRGDEWLQYAGMYDTTLNETIIIKANGL